MTVIYLIRHGVTDSNITGVFQGTTDTPLNETGLKQAERLVDYFHDIHLDAIYASPLCRAHQTAVYFAGSKNISIETVPGLIELNGGDLEGRTDEDNRRDYPDVIHNLRGNLHEFAAPGGESLREAYDRMIKTMELLINENPDKSIAVVSHGLVIQAFLSYVMGVNFDEIKIMILGNASVCKMRAESAGRIVLETCNELHHLPASLIIDTPDNDAIRNARNYKKG